MAQTSACTTRRTPFAISECYNFREFEIAKMVIVYPPRMSALAAKIILFRYWLYANQRCATNKITLKLICSLINIRADVGAAWAARTDPANCENPFQIFLLLILFHLSKGCPTTRKNRANYGELIYFNELMLMHRVAEPEL